MTAAISIDDVVKVQSQLIEVVEALTSYAEVVDRRLNLLEGAAQKPLQVVVKMPKRRLFPTLIITGVGCYYIHKAYKEFRLAVDTAGRDLVKNRTVEGEVAESTDTNL